MKKIIQFLLLVLVINTVMYGNTNATKPLQNNFTAESRKEMGYLKNELIVRMKEEKSTPVSVLSISAKSLKSSGITSDIKLERILNEGDAVNNYKKNHTKISSATFSTAYNAMDKKQKSLYRTYKARLPKKSDMKKVIEALGGNSRIESVQPNYLYTSSYIPTDSRYSEQWAHTLAGAEKAWDTTKGDKKVVVAVLDSGVDYKHPDLAVNIWRDANGNPGKDFVNVTPEQLSDNLCQPLDGEDYLGEDNDPSDFNGHGTHCAGIIGAVENGTGVVGIAPKVSIMPIRAGFSVKNFFIGGDRELGLFSDEGIIKGIMYAADNKADVLSMSFGGENFSPAVKDAIDYAYSKGVTLIAAAGNSNLYLPHYPAGYPNVISVSSVDKNGEKAYYSNYGYWVTLAAPGGIPYVTGSGILSTVPTRLDPSGYKEFAGTSMAGPYVAGVAALIKSMNYNLTNEEISSILQNSVTDYKSASYMGAGVINAQKALSIKSIPKMTATITSPAFSENVLLQGKTELQIIGEVAGDSYELSYGRGYNPATWTLIYKGYGALKGVIGKINTSALDDDLYTIKLTVVTGGYKKSTGVLFCSRKDEKTGWGSKEQSGIIMSDAALLETDLNNDGKKEVIIPDNSGKIYAYNADGTTYPGSWPVNILVPELKDAYGKFLSTLSAGDMNGDGNKEIVAVQFETNAMYVISHTGYVISQRYPIYDLAFSSTGYVRMADVNNDGKDEAVYLSCLNGIATLEILDVMLNPIKKIVLTGRTGLSFGIAPYVIDMDGDGKKEIVTIVKENSATVVEVRDIDGNILNTNTIPLSFFRLQARVADLYGDGKYEVILMEQLNISYAVRVEIVGKNYIKQIPITDTIASCDMEVADINSDGYPEIILRDWAMTTGKFLAYNNKGEKIKTINYQIEKGFYPFGYNKTIADVDGDGECEILFNTCIPEKTYLNIHAIKLDGTEAKGFPKNLFSDIWPAMMPDVADIDGNGRVEIISGGKGVRIFELPQFAKPVKTEISTYENDDKRSGVYKAATAPQKDTIKIYYKSSWNNTCIHYTVDAKPWTNLPGSTMNKYDDVDGYNTIVIEGKTLQAAFNNGAGVWDNNNRMDYRITKPGVYTIENNSIKEGKPAKGLIKIFYKTTWTNAYIHFNLNNKGWTNLPGVSMAKAVANPAYRSVETTGSYLVAAFNNGNGGWDNNGNKNYTINAPGEYWIENGVITKK